MIKRALQLVEVGLNYAAMFAVGFVFTFMIFAGIAWAIDTSLEFVTMADPIYNSWFHTFTIAATFVMSLIVGIAFLGNEERERRKYND